MLEEEFGVALGRACYERSRSKGHRHSKRERQLLRSFGPAMVKVPPERLARSNGTTEEWCSATLPGYARMTRQAEALIASAYLAGTNTRRVKRALGALFKRVAGKDVVSHTWRRVKADWDAWNRRSLADEDIVMPELGRASWEQAAALAGLAPFDDDSGGHRGQRHIAGGRGRLHRSPKAAALPAAFRWNPALRVLYGHLIARGKGHKAALVACARKLIVYANTVVQRGSP
jgi:transposase